MTDFATTTPLPSSFTEPAGPPAPELLGVQVTPPGYAYTGDPVLAMLYGRNFVDGMTVAIDEQLTVERIRVIDERQAEVLFASSTVADPGAHAFSVTTPGGTTDELSLTLTERPSEPVPTTDFLLDTFAGGPELLDAHVGETGAVWSIADASGANTDGTVESGGVSCESDGVHGLGLTPFYQPTGRPAGGRYQVRVAVDRFAPGGTNPIGTVTLALADLDTFPGFAIQYVVAYIQWDDFAGGAIEFDMLDGFSQTIPFAFNAAEEHEITFIVETDGTVALWLDGVEIASHTEDGGLPLPAVLVPIVQVSNYTDEGFEKILRLVEIEGADL